MKVNNEINHALTSSTPAAARPAASTSKTAEPTAAIGSVKISDASRALVAGTSDTQAPFDAKRVSEIKDAISAGQFKVDPEKVADKVLDSASQLLTGKA